MIRRSLPAVFALIFAAPLLAAPAGQQTLFNFVRPADVVKVVTENTDLPQANAEQTPEGEVLRRVTFNPVARPTLRLTPQTGAWDWSQSGMMSLRLQSAMNWAVTVYVQIQSNNGQTLTSRVDLPAGPAQTLLVPLVATSPLSQGMKAGPPMPMTVDGQRILLASSSGELDRSQVVSVSLWMDQPKAAQSLLLERFGVQDGDAVTQAVYGNLVDAYGQSTRSKWPEKISNDEQLKSAAAKEQQQLKTWLAEREKSSLDKFGGWNKGPAFKASGFFRTEKRDGRWYLVTPEGHPFYSLGVNTVSPQVNQTYVAGREWMFESLPKPDEPLASHFGEGDTVAATAPIRAAAMATGAGTISMVPTCNVCTANLAQHRRKPNRQLRRARPRSISRSGPRIPSTACRPGVSTPSATGVPTRSPTPSGCRTPCRCRSSATTPASAPAATGGAACLTRSTRVSPWPPSVPWPSPPAIIVMIRG